MKREIKFRTPHFKLSDDSFSHFSYWGWIDYKGNSSDSSFTSPSQNSHTYRKDDDQFTGLKDKNGREVYEGDICKIYFDVNKIEDYIYNSLTKSEIDTGTKVFIVESPLFNNQVEFTADVIEVIGNIYENPELLKA